MHFILTEPDSGETITCPEDAKRDLIDNDLIMYDGRHWLYFDFNKKEIEKYILMTSR
jgi:hypothetical protein